MKTLRKSAANPPPIAEAGRGRSSRIKATANVRNKRGTTGARRPRVVRIAVWAHSPSIPAPSAENRTYPKNTETVSYTHLRAHETDSYLVCRLLLEKKKTKHNQ